MIESSFISCMARFIKPVVSQNSMGLCNSHDCCIAAVAAPYLLPESHVSIQPCRQYTLSMLSITHVPSTSLAAVWLLLAPEQLNAMHDYLLSCC